MPPFPAAPPSACPASSTRTKQHRYADGLCLNCGRTQRAIKADYTEWQRQKSRGRMTLHRTAPRTVALIRAIAKQGNHPFTIDVLLPHIDADHQAFWSDRQICGNNLHRFAEKGWLSKLSEGDQTTPSRWQLKPGFNFAPLLHELAKIKVRPASNPSSPVAPSQPSPHPGRTTPQESAWAAFRSSITIPRGSILGFTNLDDADHDRQRYQS